MLKAIEAYLALRRATGFAMLNAEYLLKSFAAFATERGQTHVRVQTAIDWAARGPSVTQRDARNADSAVLSRLSRQKLD
jgi:integrase/recombinase XerD